MPESFDSMLEELAEAAVLSTVPPGAEAARRRARERTVQRRVVISALVLVLVGGSGGAWAALDRQEAAERTVATAGAGASPAASPSPSLSAVGTASGGASGFLGAYSYASGADFSVWRTAAKSDGYLLIFSDGVVALSTPSAFPLCYGQMKTAGVDSTALSSAVPVSRQLLADVSCDDFGVTSGLSVAPTKSGDVLQVGVPSNGGGPGYQQLYTRQDTDTSGAAASPMTYLPSGTWKSADAEARTLQIASNGSIVFTAFANFGKQYAGSGTVSGAVDAVYPSGARVLIDCGTVAGMASAAAGGAKATPCGVVLIEQDPQASDEITVYSSYGPETFIRTG